VFVLSDRRVEAERLRRECGLSVKEVAARVEISASTASRWLREIVLTAEQLAVLDARNPAINGQMTGARRLAEKARTARSDAQEHGRALAALGDPLHRAGCMLYWAEGSKGRNKVTFTNSDADMVRFFLRFLRKCYEVDDERVTLSVNVHLGNGFTLEEIESWWLAALALPTSCLRAAAVNRTSSSSLGKRPPLIHGTARLSIGSTFIVQSIYGALQAYGGFERSAWLD
jgi:predicted transcriptional regulator